MNSPHTPNSAQPSHPPIAVQYRLVSLRKLIILYFASLGFYTFVWFYRNWKIVRDERKDKVTPWVRTLFSGFTAYGLFRRIFADTQNRSSYVSKYSADILGAGYLLFMILGRLPGNWGLISIFAFLPLVEVQKVINSSSPTPPDDTLTSKHWVLIVIGAIVWVLVLIGLFIPE